MLKKRNRMPRRVFIETSVFIRFLTNDDQKKAADCRTLFEAVERGETRPYISNVVVLEVVFVLDRLYRFSRNDIVDAVEKILDLRNITVIERTNTESAIKLWSSGKKKYGDCLIASQVPNGVPIVTYDADFKTFSNVHPLIPADVI